MKEADDNLFSQMYSNDDSNFCVKNKEIISSLDLEKLKNEYENRISDLKRSHSKNMEKIQSESNSNLSKVSSLEQTVEKQQEKLKDLQ